MSDNLIMPQEIQSLWAEWRPTKKYSPPDGFLYGRFRNNTGMELGYRAYTPKSSRPHPLVVYMAGTHHNNNETNDEQIRNVGCHTLASPYFPYICHVLAPWIDTPGHMPNTSEGRQMNLKYSAALDGLVRTYIANHSVDQKRIYFIGVGGGAQYQHVAQGADIYAAIAMNTSVFDYFADNSENHFLNMVAHIPIYLSHGICDKPNPVRRSRYAYDLLRKAGNDAVVYREYTVQELIRAGANLDTFDGAHNTACALPFLSADMYNFLFSKQREINSI